MNYEEIVITNPLRRHPVEFPVALPAVVFEDAMEEAAHIFVVGWLEELQVSGVA